MKKGRFVNPIITNDQVTHFPIFLILEFYFKNGSSSIKFYRNLIQIEQELIQILFRWHFMTFILKPFASREKTEAVEVQNKSNLQSSLVISPDLASFHHDFRCLIELAPFSEKSHSLTLSKHFGSFFG